MKKIFWVSVLMNVVIGSTSFFCSAQSSGPDNALTTKEKNEGWILLFDGRDMAGWRTFKNIPGNWVAKNGTLCSEKPVNDENPDIITNEQYENFELQVDWNLSPLGNSGIMYLVTEAYDATFLSGPEYQLIDDENFPEKIEDWQKTAANYAMNTPAVKAYNKPGQWNHTVIILNKGHVEHWLNGKKVVEYELWTDEWKKAKANGKWKDAAGYAASRKGHIAFQASHSGVEGSGVCFKNIKIRPIQ